MISFTLHLPEAEGFFFDIYYVPGGKSHTIMGCTYNGPSGAFTLRVVHIEIPAIQQLQIRFSYLAPVFPS